MNLQQHSDGSDGTSTHTSGSLSSTVSGLSLDLTVVDVRDSSLGWGSRRSSSGRWLSGSRSRRSRASWGEVSNNGTVCGGSWGDDNVNSTSTLSSGELVFRTRCDGEENRVTLVGLLATA